MYSIRTLLVFTVLLMPLVSIEAAPFFDALYDVLKGNPRRSYGYGGYGGYGYDYGYQNGYQNGYGNNGYRNVERPRQGKTFKEICRVHYPDAAAVPGTGGIVCPY